MKDQASGSQSPSMPQRLLEIEARFDLFERSDGWVFSTVAKKAHQLFIRARVFDLSHKVIRRTRRVMLWELTDPRHCAM